MDTNGNKRVACSRLRDSGEKGEEKTRAKKRAGAGERLIFAFPLSSRRPLVFAPTLLLSESLEQANKRAKINASVISNSAHPPRAHPRALGFLETNRQMLHSGDKQAVQMPRCAGKKNLLIS